MTKPGVGVLCAAALSVVVPAHRAAGQAGAGRSGPESPGETLPETLTLTGVVRDFRAFNVAGGHPDFERYSTGHRVEMVEPELDGDGKPLLAGQGRTVTAQFRDSQGRNINPAMFDAARGDVAGVLADATATAVTNAASFAQWYRDTPGINLSKPHAIVLQRQAASNLYVFEATNNPATQAIEGFFPADHDLYNDMIPAYGHNYFFTFELSATFVYRRGTGQVFTFAGDDDVWVFIDNRLVIDVGGVHGPVTQTIDLDRIDGLEDGQAYPLKFFFAERHTTGSNCRIETSLTLVPAELPATSALYD
jgi:fibro-slime domain-containing protein